MDTGTTVDLYSIWVDSSNEAFSVGSGGIVAHYKPLGDCDDDGVINIDDNCPNDYNPLQNDSITIYRRKVAVAVM